MNTSKFLIAAVSFGLFLGASAAYAQQTYEEQVVKNPNECRNQTPAAGQCVSCLMFDTEGRHYTPACICHASVGSGDKLKKNDACKLNCPPGTKITCIGNSCSCQTKP